MSSDLFHAARVKVRRARHHISHIQPEMEAVHRAHHQRMVGLSASVWAKRRLRGIVPEMTLPERQLDEMACCVGDAVHNLRAALDLLACEIVELSGESPKDVHFPFAQTEAELTSPKGGMVKRKKFDRARSDAQTLHLALRPHGEPHGNALLWGLHRLDLVDKHQDLLSLSHHLPTPTVYIRGHRATRQDEQPARLVFAPDTAFAGEEIMAVLDGFAGEVERVIESFARLFL